MHFSDCARKGRLLMRITAHGSPLLSLVMRLAHSPLSLLLACKRGRNLDNMPFNFVPFSAFIRYLAFGYRRVIKLHFRSLPFGGITACLSPDLKTLVLTHV